MQYQNCAPSNEIVDSNQTVTPGSVDVIDQVQTGGISFAQSKVDAFNDEQLTVMGVCEQSGSLISWRLHDSNGNVIEKGLAECDLGAFEVALTEDWSNHCDEQLQLSAALGADAASETLVEAICN